MQTTKYKLMQMLPKNHLSHFVGQLVHSKLPAPVSKKAVHWFAKRYNINLAEAEHDIDFYKTIGDLFTRKLKPGARPIGPDIVHPCDAVITEFGYSYDGVAIQSKGRGFTIEQLLRSEEMARPFVGGLYLTYYLCPTDYHRVHAPIAGEVIESVHIPGQLWPVNAWSVDHVENLYVVNERVVTLMKSPKGRVAVIMVGATNVGKITVSYDNYITSNRLNRHHRPKFKSYDRPKSLEKGDELGIFHMGSTVIVLFERDTVDVTKSELKGPTRLGESFAKYR